VKSENPHAGAAKTLENVTFHMTASMFQSKNHRKAKNPGAVDFIPKIRRREFIYASGGQGQAPAPPHPLRGCGPLRV
jgi:hypothetical protein